MSAPDATIEIQLAVEDADEPPEPATLRAWAAAALAAVDQAGAVVTLRVVDRAEGRALNRLYRGRDYATNVLSFPFGEVAPEVAVEFGGHCLGDIAICAPVVEREAGEQGKSPAAHWAHMVVHGVLHLAGFDHDEPCAAAAMEARERAVLAEFGFGDPYAEGPTGAAALEEQ